MIEFSLHLITGALRTIQGNMSNGIIDTLEIVEYGRRLLSKYHADCDCSPTLYLNLII